MLLLLFIAGSCHSRSLRELVGSQVVRVTKEDGLSGGTGVHVRTPSGHLYLMTNKHICREADKDGQLWVGFDEGPSVPKHVIKMSEDSDLCLMEPLDGMEGIQLASEELKPGQDIAIFGHPLLQPLSEAKGQYVGMHLITVLQFLITSEDKRLECSGQNEEIQTIPVMGGFLQIDACLSRETSELSDAQIYPGNSGSPMVDLGGKLVGLVFAGSSETNWAESVSLSDIRSFLHSY